VSALDQGRGTSAHPSVGAAQELKAVASAGQARSDPRSASTLGGRPVSEVSGASPLCARRLGRSGRVARPALQEAG
jgi:hypothetical protein